MKRKNLILILSAIFLIIVIGIIYCTSKSVLKYTDINRIEIKRGTTGTVYVLEEDAASDLATELSGIESKISGIDIYSMGYEYIVDVHTDKGVKSITIKDKQVFVKGIIKYKTTSDVISIIEKAIAESGK